MRRSYVQPPSHNQRAVSFSSDHHDQRRKEKLREKRNNLWSTTSSDVAKKAAAEGCSEMTKLERKPTEDINASADAFIKKFRQQLVIQRLQSIENYEQMLARGL